MECRILVEAAAAREDVPPFEKTGGAILEENRTREDATSNRAGKLGEEFEKKWGIIIRLLISDVDLYF